MIFPRQGYAPHQAFVAPARPRTELWRTALGIVLIGAIYVGLMILFVALVRSHYGGLIGAAIYASMIRGISAGSMILLLLSFLALAIAVLAVTRGLHGRRVASLFGPPGKAAHDFLRVAAVLIALNLVLLPFAMSADTLTRHLDLRTFLFCLPFALVGLLVQTGAEELVFRGYLQQQLGARFRTPWVWLVLPQALFAWAHYAPEVYGSTAPAIFVWAALFGLFAADLTARSGSLGAAMGFHFANNLAAFLLVGIDGDMNGLALWSLGVDLTDPEAVWPLLQVDFLTMTVAWLLARLALRL